MVQGLLFLCPLPEDIILKTLYFSGGGNCTLLTLSSWALFCIAGFQLVCTTGGRLSPRGRKDTSHGVIDGWDGCSQAALILKGKGTMMKGHAYKLSFISFSKRGRSCLPRHLAFRWSFMGHTLPSCLPKQALLFCPPTLALSVLPPL